MRFFVVLACSALFLLPSMAFAQQVSEGEVSSTSVVVRSKERTISCFQGKPGTLKEKRGQLIFTSLSKTIKRLNNRAKRLSGSQAEKFKKRARLQRQIRKAGNNACSQSPQQPKQEPQQPSGGSSNGGAYFDGQGRVTTAGKTALGIPSNFNPDVITGSQRFFAYCSGCHEERRRFTMSELRQAIEREPMNYTRDILPDSDLAQIMAYVSRFRLPPS